jgi:thymidylate synthase (FAD)
MIEFVNPSVEFMFQPTTSIEKLIHLERAGRTCYKSESEYTEASALRFFKETVGRRHYSVLEHAYKTVCLSDVEYCYLITGIASVNSDIMDFIKKIEYYDEDCACDSKYYLSINYRTIAELIELVPLLQNVKRLNTIKIINIIAKNTPFVEYLQKLGMYEEVPNRDIDLLKNEHSLTPYQIDQLVRVSFRVITSRGISHEFVRHRSHTFSQESSRYVGYMDKPIQMIVSKPGGELEEQYNKYVGSGEWDINRWISETSTYERNGDVPEHLIYCHACVMSATDYTLMIEAGAPKGRARDVLPNGLKTEFVVTASLYYWKHCLELRTDKPAHHDIRYLVNIIHGQLKEAYPDSNWDIIPHSQQSNILSVM